MVIFQSKFDTYDFIFIIHFTIPLFDVSTQPERSPYELNLGKIGAPNGLIEETIFFNN